MAGSSRIDGHAADNHGGATGHSRDWHGTKMTKAMIGIGLMFALSFVLSAVGAVNRWEAHHPATATQPPQGQGYDTEHLAPREDHSLH